MATEKKEKEAQKPVLSAAEIAAILDTVDWSKVNDGAAIRAALEQNPKAVKQLSDGIATDMFTFKETVEGMKSLTADSRPIQLVPIFQYDKESKKNIVTSVIRRGELKHDAKKVFATPDNKDRDEVSVYINSKKHVLDPWEKDADGNYVKDEKGHYVKNATVCKMLEQLLSDEGCYCCDIPFNYTVKVKDENGNEVEKERTFFLGMDSRSGHISAYDSDLLCKRYLDEKGQTKATKLFGRFDVTDEAMAEITAGRISAVKGTTADGKLFTSALIFDVTRKEIVEDRSRKGKEVAAKAYRALTATAAEAPAEQKEEKPAKTSKKSTKQAKTL